MQSTSLLDSLNPQQRLAVLHGTASAQPAGPLLIVAGAGTGKTQTLAHRVAQLIASGADPQRMLLLTFSRRAAQEMERRVAAVLRRALGLPAGAAPIHLPWSGTFHAIGARLLREYAPRIGLDDSFTLHDRGDSEDLMGLVRHERGLSELSRRFPQKGTCLSIYSRVLNTCSPLPEVLLQHYPWCVQWEDALRGLFGAYVEAKQRHNVVDYDDLLSFWAELADQPAWAAELGARFDHLLVDEYQDTNRLQARILLALKPDGAGLTVVGDDAQSIYSFRGATVRNILDFPRQFGGVPVRVVTLEQNYRSTQPIVQASNAVIAAARERHVKCLHAERGTGQRPRLVLVADEAQQARCVAQSVLQARESGMQLRNQAVLFRTSHHSAALELELARCDIPFQKFGGLKFLEAAHIKDVLALLRFAQNPRGRLAGFRAALLVEGIGQASAARLLDALAVAADPGAALRAFDPPSSARAGWPAFVALLAQLRSPQSDWPQDMALATTWYLAQLERLHDDAPARRLDVEQLARLAAGYPSRERFLTELTLDPPQASSDESGPAHQDEDYLILSTIHSAKGQEWKAVHVLNVVDGCIPSDLGAGSTEDIEEERRLLYVAMTRARDRLQLMVPQRFHVTQQAAGGDRHIYAGRSRFLTEAMLEHFEQAQWPPPQAGEERQTQPQPAAATTPVLQVRERARMAWRA